MSFWSAIDFWRDSVIAVALAGALLGFLGVYIVLRRVVFVGAALTQISGVGIAAAFWLASYFPAQDAHHGGHSWWLSPEIFSVAAAIGGALLFALLFQGARARRLSSEAVVALGWVLAAAALLLILSSKRIVAEAHEVDDILYGSAVLVRPSQLRALAVVVTVVIAVHMAFYKEFLLATYDPETANALGYRTAIWDLILYATFGVGISFATRTIGALPAFGFVVIPAASALLLVRRVVWAFPLAVLFAVCGGVYGYYLSFTKHYPTGPAIVAGSAIFLLPGLVKAVVWRS
jgi:zinc transport system permease protein